MSGTTDQIKGCAKEAIGILTSDNGLKAEGKLDQKTGKIKDAVAQMIDKAKNAARPRKER